MPKRFFTRHLSRNRTLTALALVLATAPWAPQAAADEAEKTAPGLVEGGIATAPLEAISVTATLNPIRAFEYPGMVSVIGREEITQRQASTPDDILQYVPGVEFTGGPRRTGEVPSIRGFSGPDVVVLFDGARQNFGSAHDGRFFIDPGLLREVEVLRGPASSLYGSGGTGGVIAFRTVRAEDLLAPDETVGVEVAAGYQTVNDEPAGTLTAFGRPSDGMDLIASVTRRTSGEIELGDGNTLDNVDDDILSAFAKATVELRDFHSLELSYIRFANDAREPNNGQDPEGDNIVDKEIRSDTGRVLYSYENPDDALFDTDLLVYFSKQEADEQRLDDNGTGPAGELLRRDVDTVGLRLDNRSRWDISDSVSAVFTYGGEAYRDKQDGGDSTGERDGVPDAESDFLAGFAQAEINIAEPFGVVPGDLLLIPGVRVDSFTTESDLATNDIEETQLSPRFGVSYLPNDWLLLFANYAQAFRAPTFNETFLTGVHFQIPIGPGITNFFVPNPDLRPQTTETYEFGAGLSFKDIVEPGDRLEVKGSYFIIEGEDFIDLQVVQPSPFVDCNPFIPGNCNGTSTSTNVADASLDGAEIEAFYDNARFRVGVGFSTIDGENEATGEPLGVLTPDEVTLSAAVKVPEVDVVAGWRALIASEFDNTNDPDEFRDAYDVHNFYVTWAPSQPALKGLRIDLGIDNAFDEAYSRVFTGATEAGRNFKAQARYTLTW
ncbi:MAG: TonB-dependent receptor [Alphaproteobacteria bacterium]|nr:TonB-dependent receptor [Alphaproteobacteria bacterium]